MIGLDLFSGYGGITLALQDYVTPILYCEIEKYAQATLLSRFHDESLPFAPIWDDITTLDGGKFKGLVDIIYGGFPCTDVSVAGLRRGLEGKRSGLVKEVYRLTEEINPSFVFLENVPGIRTKGLREIIRVFTDLRYDARWSCLSAREVGAPHLRKRWFLLAHSKCKPVRNELWRRSWEAREGAAIIRNNGQEESLARNISNADSKGFSGQTNAAKKEDAEGRGEGYWRSAASTFERDWWASQPTVCRVANGTSIGLDKDNERSRGNDLSKKEKDFRINRIKALGNGVVPAQCKEAFERLMGLK